MARGKHWSISQNTALFFTAGDHVWAETEQTTFQLPDLQGARGFSSPSGQGPGLTKPQPWRKTGFRRTLRLTNPADSFAQSSSKTVRIFPVSLTGNPLGNPANQVWAAGWAGGVTQEYASCACQSSSHGSACNR